MWRVKFVEEHKHHDKKNLFEKVVTMTKRAKSLYSLEESTRANLKHKPTFQAILENNEGQVILTHSSRNIDKNDNDPE